ncbi:hypothetical protein GCM10009745_43020 [Kribbella yunnanensis]|uniref:Uncharacterized protein n=1 Tax=Kribbella yunnanensis TaxID=190194 RepID=A0ABP4TTU8_9ACTN
MAWIVAGSPPTVSRLLTVGPAAGEECTREVRAVTTGGSGRDGRAGDQYADADPGASRTTESEAEDRG